MVTDSEWLVQPTPFPSFRMRFIFESAGLTGLVLSRPRRKMREFDFRSSRRSLHDDGSDREKGVACELAAATNEWTAGRCRLKICASICFFDFYGQETSFLVDARHVPRFPAFCARAATLSKASSIRHGC